VSGDRFRRYGGGTTCYQLDVADDHILLLDVGTGALNIPVGESRPMRFSILMTHVHWDHTLALPFFRPLFDPANRFDFYGHPVAGMDLEEVIDRVMRPPWFPVNFRSTPSVKRFHQLEDTSFTIGDVTVTSRRLHHPDGVSAYRLERDGAVLAFATDIEHGDPASDGRLRDLARDADVLVCDAQYLPDQYENGKVGWGHSTWMEAVRLAGDCNARRLVLTSHDPDRSDESIDHLVAQARSAFPNTDAAREGMVIEVG
jgi:phosphoribosyl 1,2-cyclic phosphodiesterase